MTDDGARLFVRASPGARKDSIEGVWRGVDGEARLAVKVTAIVVPALTPTIDAARVVAKVGVQDDLQEIGRAVPLALEHNLVWQA